MFKKIIATEVIYRTGNLKAKMHIENVFCFWYYKND